MGTTRPGRARLPVSRWMSDHATKHGWFDVGLVDLAGAGVALPISDEPHPAPGQVAVQAGFSASGSVRIQARTCGSSASCWGNVEPGSQPVPAAAARHGDGWTGGDDLYSPRSRWHWAAGPGPGQQAG